MKNWLIALGLFISLSIVQAQSIANSLLWEVSGNGLKSSSYLFGTLHATCNTQLQPRVEKALSETEQLALEIDMSDTSIPMKMAQQMYLKNEKQLLDFVNEEDVPILKEFLATHIPMYNFEMLNKIKPFFINSMLISTVLSCPMPQAYDIMLMTQAQKQNLPIVGLEEIEDQLAIFDAISLEEQVAYLLETAKDNLTEYQKDFDELLALYDEENINRMYRLMEEDDSYITKQSYVLLDERNEKWVPKIEKMMLEKPSFIGFGAMHLAGEMGVIHLLRKKGYTVEAVKK